MKTYAITSFEDSRISFEFLPGGVIGRSLSTEEQPIEKGLVGIIGGKSYCLYRDDAGLHFLGEDITGELITSDTEAEMTERLGKRHLKITNCNRVVVDIEYYPRRGLSPMATLFDFTCHDEEFDDFGLFLFNVIQQPERKDIIFDPPESSQGNPPVKTPHSP